MAQATIPIESLPVVAPEVSDYLLGWGSTQDTFRVSVSGFLSTIDHGSLVGLGDDDHPSYFNQARGDARYALLTDTRFHDHTNKTTLDKITESGGLPLWNGSAWPGGSGGGGVTDHGALTGLGDDDHPIYYNQARGDARYLQIATASSTYLTQANAASTYLTQANAASTYLTSANAASTYLTQANAASTYALLTDTRFHTHTNKTTLDKITESANLPLWNGAAWPGVTSHAALTGLGADDHAQYFNQTRGDARYLQISTASSTYATQTSLTNHTDDTDLHLPGILGTANQVLTVVGGVPSWANSVILESPTVKRIKVDTAGTDADTLYISTT